MHSSNSLPRVILAAVAASVFLLTAFSASAQVVAPTTPANATAAPQWEYGRLTYNIGGGGYSWTTATERIGDGNYKKFLAQLGFIGLENHPSGEMAVLGLLGSQGWELVSCQIARVPGVLSESDVTACYFKRPVGGRG
jgi:hypothetical protein